MLTRTRRPAWLALGLMILLVGPAMRPAPDAARLVVRNGTYSSLLISMRDDSGREIRLGQAPPEFTNTLVIREPLPTSPVRFVARLVGESSVLYDSEPVRLGPDVQLRWRLPENVIER